MAYLYRAAFQRSQRLHHREEHAFITNASLLKDKTIAVPSGTSIEEKVRRDYPNLKILNTGNSEAEVFKAVAERRADLTLRSLTVSAYTIRKEGAGSPSKSPGGP